MYVTLKSQKNILLKKLQKLTFNCIEHWMSGNSEMAASKFFLPRSPVG